MNTESMNWLLLIPKCPDFLFSVSKQQFSVQNRFIAADVCLEMTLILILYCLYLFIYHNYLIFELILALEVTFSGKVDLKCSVNNCRVNNISLCVCLPKEGEERYIS